MLSCIDFYELNLFTIDNLTNKGVPVSSVCVC